MALREAKRVSRAVAVLGAAALVVLVVATWGSVSVALVDATRWLERYVRGAGAWGVVAFVLFSSLSVVLGPFTAAPLVPAGVLAWGRTETLALLVTAWMLGDVTAYLLGRSARRPLRRTQTWHRVEEWKGRLSSGRTLAVAIVLRLTLPSEVSYAFGALRFHFGWFFVLTLVAELPTAALLVFGSEALVQGRGMKLGAIAVAAVGLAVAAWLVRSALKGGDAAGRNGWGARIRT